MRRNCAQRFATIQKTQAVKRCVHEDRGWESLYDWLRSCQVLRSVRGQLPLVLGTSLAGSLSLSLDAKERRQTLSACQPAANGDKQLFLCQRASCCSSARILSGCWWCECLLKKVVPHPCWRRRGLSHMRLFSSAQRRSSCAQHARCSILRGLCSVRSCPGLSERRPCLECVFCWILSNSVALLFEGSAWESSAVQTSNASAANFSFTSALPKAVVFDFVPTANLSCRMVASCVTGLFPCKHTLSVMCVQQISVLHVVSVPQYRRRSMISVAIFAQASRQVVLYLFRISWRSKCIVRGTQKHQS